MQKSKKIKPLAKWIIGSGIFIVLLVTAVLFWQFNKYRIIRNEIRHTVNKISNGLYTIDYDKMHLDEVNGLLTVTNLTLKPDTAVFNKLKAEKKNPALLIQLFIPELRITGIKTIKAITNNKIECAKVEIKNAKVELYAADKSKDSTTAKPAKELYEQLLGKWKLIKADEVITTNTSVAFIDISNNKKMAEATGLSVALTDVWIDSLHSLDSTRYLFAKKILLKADKGIIKNKQGTYFYKFTGLEFTTGPGLFSIKNAEITPWLNETEFAKAAVLQTDRFNFSFQDIVIKDINLPELMHGSLIARELIIRQSNCKVFRDLSYPRDNKIRVGTYPQQQLMEMPIPVSIKKIVIADAFIEYKEFTPVSGDYGKVQFENANVVITHVTNIPIEITADNNCVIVFNAGFHNLAKVNAQIILKLKDPQGRFLINGSATGFDATKLNDLLKPMALAVIESGTINKVDFNYQCNNYGSDGTLVLLYDNLKLTLLKKNKDEIVLKKKVLASVVANLLIKNANPLRKQEIRKAKLHYKRDPNRTFFNLIWKSILKGIKETIGMKSKD